MQSVLRSSLGIASQGIGRRPRAHRKIKVILQVLEKVPGIIIEGRQIANRSGSCFKIMTMILTHHGIVGR